jgi:hypothetical protein
LALLPAHLGAADDALEQVRVRVLGNLERLPDFTCMETIERLSQHGAKPRRMDTILLESSYVGGQELVSWPGQAALERQTVLDLAKGGGLISFGDFALHLRALFGRSGAEFSAPEPEARDGRETLRWSFRVPREKSSYKVGDTRTRTVVAYHGAIRADAKTFDLIRLEIVADGIPTEIGMSSAETAIDYSRVRIAETEVVLPSATRIVVRGPDGQGFENRATFTGCRKFTGQSTITFGDAPEAGAEAGKASLTLPAGVRLTATLEETIDLEHAAIGQTVEMTLLARVSQGATEYFPKGTRLVGRITRLKGRSPHYLVGIRFTAFESRDRRAEARLALDEIFAAGNRYHIVSPAPTDPETNAAKMSAGVSRPPRGEAVFFTESLKSTLPRGLRLELRTLAPEDGGRP